MRITFGGTSIGSIEALAKALDVSEGFLLEVAQNPCNFYSVTQIPKKTGGLRTISDPVRELKIVQRRIIRRILSHCNFPDYLYGSIKDERNPRDFVRNARAHAAAVEVIAFDIDSFFPSVQPGFVKSVFKYLLRFPDDVATLLVSLTTLEGGLPQGAPTSSYLANLIFYNNEHRFYSAFCSRGLSYTRLIDDITVSSEKELDGNSRKVIYSDIKRMLAEKKLIVSKHKYKITNTSVAGAKSVVTGLIVENGRVKLTKDRIKSIGGLVHSLDKRSQVSTCEHEFHIDFGKASGLVALYKRLDPDKAANYRKSLRSFQPTYDAKKIKKIAYLCRKFIAYAKSHSDKFDDEGYARKYYRFRQKLSIMRRTERKRARALEVEMMPYRPLRLLRSYYE